MVTIPSITSAFKVDPRVTRFNGVVATAFFSRLHDGYLDFAALLGSVC